MTSLIPYVDQVVLFNNQRAYTVALIVPNKEALRRALPDLDTMEGRLKGVRLIEKSLNEYKQGGKYAGIFPERWLPAAFALLDEPFGEQNQTMNSTMKLVRGKIESLYARRIEFLYTPDGKHSENKPNLDALA
jgi:long-chain acyl-CoA synthetase